MVSVTNATSTWLAQSTKGTTGNQTTYEFSGSVDLTTGATVDGSAS
jgi:hypothetical protein